MACLVALASNASVARPSTSNVNTLEHDPEKWKPVFEKIMLKQRDEIMMRFHLIAS
jgi:hypothetical protein